MESAPKLGLLIILLCISSSASPSQDPDTAVVDSFIASQAKRLGGEEYGEARKVVAGDLNHDSKPDSAILYTIEGMGGGNNHVQYLAVFARAKGRLGYVTHAAVGGKLNRSVELKGITNNVILFETLSYRANDPSCCPTRKGTAKFVLKGKTLRELR
jgi:hypothetical protein